MSRPPGSPGMAAAGIAAALAAACAGPRPMAESTATVSLSTPALFYEAGEPIRLDLAVFNPGTEAVAWDAGLFDGRALECRRADGTLLQPAPAPGPPAEVAPIPPGGRAERPFEPLLAFGVAAVPGRYRVTAGWPGRRSNTVDLLVLPRFDPAADYGAVLETDEGPVALRLLPAVAPRHVRNFVQLARAGFYDATLFHRLVAGRLLQGGDPGGTGRGGPGWQLEAEFSDHPFARGTVAMARDPRLKDSAGSQFFIVLERTPEWDGLYTVFGVVESGMEVVDRLAATPTRGEVPTRALTLRRVTVTQGGGAGA